MLRFAYDYDCESTLACELLQPATLLTLEALQKRFLSTNTAPDIPPRQPAADSYDHLLSGQWLNASPPETNAAINTPVIQEATTHV